MSKYHPVNLAWDSIEWPKVIERVRRVQRRIYKAKRNADVNRVYWLQKLLIKSPDAKLYSVLQVTTLNKDNKYIPRIDKTLRSENSVQGKEYKILLEELVKEKIYLTSQQKSSLAEQLSIDGQSNQIVKKGLAKKPNKLESLVFPFILDKAKQALAKLALEAEWEALFEANSYGFRPGRGPHDAMEALFLSLHHGTPKWIYAANVRKAFHHLDHDVLLAKLYTFPEMHKQIKSWLNSGLMEEYSKMPCNTIFTRKPEGSIIAPFLANVALHGLENSLREFVSDLHIPGFANKIARSKSISIVRYGDDFVLLHRNPEVLKLCIEHTKFCLKEINLEIFSFVAPKCIVAKESGIKSCTQGFHFLGFQFIQIRKSPRQYHGKGGLYKILIRPSREQVARFLLKVRKIIQTNKSESAYALIVKLRPILVGWANYYRFCECSHIFAKVSYLIFQKLRAWTFRRSTRVNRTDLVRKYFPPNRTWYFQNVPHKENWILYGSQKTKKGRSEAFLPNISWVSSLKHVKVKGDKSPFDGDHLYWVNRSMKYSPFS